MVGESAMSGATFYRVYGFRVGCVSVCVTACALADERDGRTECVCDCMSLSSL